MCEVPPRSFRRAIRPERVVIAIIAIGAIGAAFFFLSDQRITAYILLGLGTAALFAAVLFPAIRDVEFGFPSGIRVRTALNDREEELRRAFAAQKGDFTLYAQLFCTDPALAATLLEATWAKAAAEWRGPITPGLRTYVLCAFVHLVESHERWMGRPDSAAAADPLRGLGFDERTVVVLHEFAELPLAQVAAIVERPVGDVAAELRAARATIASRRGEDGAP